MNIITEDGEEHNYTIKLAFKTTNNEAEYEALLAGLEVTNLMGASEI